MQIGRINGLWTINYIKSARLLLLLKERSFIPRSLCRRRIVVAALNYRSLADERRDGDDDDVDGCLG